jgi:hypothetical protein
MLKHKKDVKADNPICTFDHLCWIETLSTKHGTNHKNKRKRMCIMQFSDSTQLQSIKDEWIGQRLLKL